jgi:hypothetical protein
MSSCNDSQLKGPNDGNNVLLIEQQLVTGGDSIANHPQARDPYTNPPEA